MSIDLYFEYTEYTSSSRRIASEYSAPPNQAVGLCTIVLEILMNMPLLR